MLEVHALFCCLKIHKCNPPFRTSLASLLIYLNGFNEIDFMNGYEYIGIDVAGGKNTWFCCLVKEENKLTFECPSPEKSLQEIVEYHKNKKHNIVSSVIDAQLTYSTFDFGEYISAEK